jgi:hypothetical protein
MTMGIFLNFYQPPAHRRLTKALAVLLLLGLSAPRAQARKQNDQRGVGARPATQVNKPPEKSKRYASIIGVDKYADGSISPLDGASNDAMEDFLQGRFRRLAENRLSEMEGPENLKKLFETIHNLIYVKKDTKSAAALLASLFPNEERAKKALRDDIPPETLQKIFDYHKQLRSLMGETNLNDLARPEQKIVKVHGATTEEIISYAQGSVAYTEFPGGARRIAGQIFRPGMTFYEVEFLEPGKDYGVKYHLFYWDGRQWTMLGPLWRALQ